MGSSLRQIRRESVKPIIPSQDTDGAPPRPATLILGLIAALFLVVLLVRGLASLVIAA